MKHILVPTDLTLSSLRLIRHAVTLLRGEPCHITLLQVAPVSDSITDLLTLPRPADRAAEQAPEFTQALARLQKVYALEIHALHLEHLYCDNALQLTQFVREQHVDLVLSTVPLTSASEPLQHFTRLLRQGAFPVLHIPEFCQTTSFRRIAVVLDADSPRSALPDQGLLQLLCRNECRLTFLLIAKPGALTDKLKQTLDTLYAAPELQPVVYSVHVVQQPSVRRGVACFVEEFEVDLVVTCRKRRLLDYFRFDSGNCGSATALTTKVPCLSAIA